ncbi:cytochrome P450 [Mycolicibacterium thermoresistibile]
MRPPGPPAPTPLSTVFGAGYAAAYAVGGNQLVNRLLKRYGPVVSLPVLGYGTAVAVADPALARQVFTAKPDVLLGGEGVGPAAAIYGPRSMFVQEEPEHLRRRRLLTPPLHGAALADQVPVIEAATRSAMASWPVGQPMRMLDAARDLTLDVIVRVIFGVGEPAEVSRLGEPFEKLLALAVSVQTPVRYALRGVGALRFWRAYRDANRRIDELVRPLIAERRAGEHQDRADILSMLVAARGEDGDRLTDDEIRDDLITLLLAGHETTATTLAWLIDYLMHHPAVLDRVRAEAHSGATDYTEAVINETLRLRPPAPVTGRMTAVPYRLGAYTLAPRTRIVLLLGQINRHPDSYPDPHEFRPERFLDTRPDPYAWVPFGGGIKRCIGASFSMCELTTILHTLLTEADLRPVSARPESAAGGASAVVVPRHGTRVYFRPTGPATSPRCADRTSTV